MDLTVHLDLNVRLLCNHVHVRSPHSLYCRSAEHTCTPSGAHTPFSKLRAQCWWKRESKYHSVDLLPVMRASSLYMISSRALPSWCAGCGCNAALRPNLTLQPRRLLFVQCNSPSAWWQAFCQVAIFHLISSHVIPFPPLQTYRTRA